MSAPVIIDAGGLLCPLPVLRLRKVLLTLAEGECVKMIATDPASQIDVPHFCAESGHAMVMIRELAGGAFEFTVRRGPASSVASGPSPETIAGKS